MGAGRKTQTFIINGNAPHSPDPSTNHANNRNLGKTHLGGVIFGCKNSTIKECLFKQLFGLPAQHFLYVKNIDPGLPLFLFNYSDRNLHGIFEAASPGQMNINPYGWTTDGSERTLYPAQVQIRVRLQCQPLPEEQFRPIIVDNYYTRNHFWFELDHAQANKLVSLLASLAVAPSTSVPPNTAKWRNIFRALPSSDTNEEGEGPSLKPFASEVERPDHSSRKSDSTDVAPCLDGVKEEDEGFKPLILEVERSNSSRKLYPTDIAPSFDGDNQPLEASSGVKVSDLNVKDHILMKLKELALNRGHQGLPLTDYVEDSAVINDRNLEDKDILGEQMCAKEKNEESPCSSSDDQYIIVQLIQQMEELKAFKTEQTLKMGYMEQKLIEAEVEIQQLKDRCSMLESVSNPSMACADDTVIDSFDELHLDPTESIFLVGGYDGESWLSVLDSYFPSQDVIKSSRPMSSVRSYASVAQLNGELYVFGGGNGYLWYDTVESYSPTTDQWTVCPSLTEKKGSLAGAALDNKIFAIGGGNGVQCFSDVEMLDFDVGGWIRTRSMLQKRFALATVELNGVLYATGGFDGNDYLDSAERFDPREHSWTKIASMNTRRGCHSLVVLNEKLYALGGFDGSTMVSSTEIFDPRLGSWITGDSMNQCRGYSAAAVVKESIYVIGGVRVDDNIDNIVDTIERFDGNGWQVINSKSVGRRCFFSAIAL